MENFTKEDLKGLFKPARDSHKGQNGKLLTIGGSELFHAASFFAADVASRIVDLVYFSSPSMENNEIMRKKAKEKFWNGIVVGWDKIDEYISEADCVLIGPGMPRESGLSKGERASGEIVNELLKKYPDKRWVVDGGALQEVDLGLLNKKVIITPHQGEFKRIMGKIQDLRFKIQELGTEDQVKLVAKELGCTVLLKGVEDVVCAGQDCGGNVCRPGQCMKVEGGNAGMTKGGTGDVLAGIVAGLYCKNEAFLSAITGSFVNKKAGEKLFERVGVNFNAGDLVKEVPGVMGEVG